MTPALPLDRVRRPAIAPDRTMATISFLPFVLHRTALAAAACCAAATHAQTVSADGAAALPSVTVTSRALPAASVAGWGDLPLDKVPLQASVYSAETLLQSGAQRLADIVRLDPAVSDAYNSVGYWDSVAIRGFVLDQRFNYRRDGLIIGEAIASAGRNILEISKSLEFLSKPAQPS